MNETRDTEDSQVRNEFGMPAAGWQHRGNGGVYAPIDASSNKALPWFSATIAGLGFGGLIILCMLQPWRTEDRASQAELRAEFAQSLAKQQSAIDRAKEDAAIAKDWTDQKNAELKIYRGAK